MRPLLSFSLFKPPSAALLLELCIVPIPTLGISGGLFLTPHTTRAYDFSKTGFWLFLLHKTRCHSKFPNSLCPTMPTLRHQAARLFPRSRLGFVSACTWGRSPGEIQVPSPSRESSHTNLLLYGLIYFAGFLLLQLFPQLPADAIYLLFTQGPGEWDTSDGQNGHCFCPCWVPSGAVAQSPVLA
jgi:hypothetical protein